MPQIDFEINRMSKQIVLFGLIEAILWMSASSTAGMSRCGCPEKCGNVSIPYPFGIGSDYCYLNPAFEIVCNSTFHPPKPFIRSLNLEVEEIAQHSSIYPYIWEPQNITVKTVVKKTCGTRNESKNSVDLSRTPYRFAADENVLLVGGCRSNVILRNRTNAILGSCRSSCDDSSPVDEKVNITSCDVGIGCCRINIHADSLNIETYSLNVSNIPTSSHNCTRTMLVSQTMLHNLNVNFQLSSVPTVLYWFVFDDSVIPPSDDQSRICSSTSEEEYGILCQCQTGYEGNPYIPHGCQVLSGCGKCKPGLCFRHYANSSAESDFYWYCGHEDADWSQELIAAISLGKSWGTVILLLFGWWLSSVVKKRRIVKQKAMYFEQNGGLLLQQQMATDESVVAAIKIFTIDELEKATDHFNEDRILGKGGQGIVYKGMLSEGRIVAVKKSKLGDESQLGDFINEVVILSQINHRNIVRLLGCCLETEVPLLVYEYIPNGTLSQHIHHPSEDFFITWRMRLQIASDSAGALAYLHTSSSIPIFHRDIKSSNILLDEKYKAKLSDFGTSKTVDVNQTHVTTRVMGTFGYLDPGYFQSSQFTEKSDVYSFGVVLVELLTGQKAVRSALEEDRSLASWFLSHLESSRMLDIIDSQVLKEGSKEEFLTIANLAKQCLNLDGKTRPTMKEVLLEIEGVMSLHLPLANDQEQQLTGTTRNMYYDGLDGGSSSNTNYLGDTSAELSLLFNPR